MQKNKFKEDDVWSDPRTAWPDENPGPDPRIRDFKFEVRSYDILNDVSDPFSESGEPWANEYTTLKAACNAYHKRIKRKATKQCDLILVMNYGSCWQKPLRGIWVPMVNDVYNYLARWRADGAFVETYHLNEMRFGERSKRKLNERTETHDTPGLFSYWKSRQEKGEQERQAKKQKAVTE